MLIIKIIFAILTAAAFVVLGVVEEKNTTDYGRTNTEYKFKLNKKQFAAIIPLAITLAIGFITVIPANTVGIKYSPFTGVQSETLTEGLKTKGFFDKVYKINTEVQTKQLADVTGQTKDSQYLTMTLDVKYKVSTDKAFEIFKQFRTLKNVDEQLIAPATQRAVETVTTKYNIIEAMGEKRNQIYNEIEKELTTRFAAAGIQFYSITFVDTDGGPEIEAAIKAEAVAKKAVETAEQERQKAEIEAQQRVIEAEADLEKARIEAETQIVNAQAEAEANKLIAESITQGLIDKIEAEARLQHGWVEVIGGNAIVDTRE